LATVSKGPPTFRQQLTTTWGSGRVLGSAGSLLCLPSVVCHLLWACERSTGCRTWCLEGSVLAKCW